MVLASQDLLSTETMGRKPEAARQHLREGGMGVDVELDVGDGLTGGHSIGGLMDEVRGVEAHDVHPQDFARVFPATHRHRNTNELGFTWHGP